MNWHTLIYGATKVNISCASMQATDTGLALRTKGKACGELSLGEPTQIHRLALPFAAGGHLILGN